MNVLIAVVSHETNTFSPAYTALEGFQSRASVQDTEGLIAHYQGKGQCVTGLIEAAQEAGAKIVFSVDAAAPPGGLVEDDAFEGIVTRLIDHVKNQQFDAILLALHGAMVTRSYQDPESEILRRIRAIAPNTPIAVALDSHANLYPETVELADVVTGYHLYPHLDMRETGLRAGRLGLQLATGEVKPTSAYGRLPMLTHMLRQGSDVSPAKELQERASFYETQPGVLASSVFTGFPYSDIDGVGLTINVITDNDEDLARSILEELSNLAWASREQFVFPVEPLSEALERAKSLDAEQTPVLLLEHSDQPGAGGPGDSANFLRALIENHFSNTVYFGIHDEEAVATAIAAGVGAKVTLTVGGRYRLDHLGMSNEPVTITGFVRTISSGIPNHYAKGYFGLARSIGKAVLLDVDGILVALLSQRAEAVDVDMLTILGVDPRRHRYLAFKGRYNWKIGLEDVPRTVIEIEVDGATPSRHEKLPFTNRQRAIYPRDGEAPIPPYEWDYLYKGTKVLRGTEGLVT